LRNRILLGQADTTSKIADYSLAGKVPVLIANEHVIWDAGDLCIWQNSFRF
jgi:glutathione S-transferase